MSAQRALAFLGSLVFGAVLCVVPALLALAAASAAAALARDTWAARAAFTLVAWPLFLALALPRVAAYGSEHGEEPIRGHAALVGLALVCWALYRWAWPVLLALASATGLFG